MLDDYGNKLTLGERLELLDEMTRTNTFMAALSRKVGEMTRVQLAFQVQTHAILQARERKDWQEVRRLIARALITYDEMDSLVQAMRHWLNEQKARDTLIANLIDRLPPGFPMVMPPRPRWPR